MIADRIKVPIDDLPQGHKTRDGAPWVMRRRTQQEMDALVAEAGFEKVATLIDDDGIFSVSLARKL